VQGVTDSTTRYSESIKKIDEELVKYRERLLAQYAALESALFKVNSLLQSLDAQSLAQQQNS
jgi:flagellar capping protein FliD